LLLRGQPQGFGGDEMKLALFIILDLLLLVLAASAQTIATVQLPDSPKPKLEETLKARYGDPLGLDKVNKTWTEAAKSPGMVIAGITLFGSTAMDIESTQACIARHTCKEGNPLMGQSRAQNYAVAFGADAVVWILGVKQKQKGRGVLTFCEDYGLSAFHFLMFARNRTL